MAVVVDELVLVEQDGGVTHSQDGQRGRVNESPAHPFAAVSDRPADQLVDFQAAQVPVDTGVPVSGSAIRDEVPIGTAFNDFDPGTEPLEVT